VARRCSLINSLLVICLVIAFSAHAAGQSIVIPPGRANAAGGDTSGPIPTVTNVELQFEFGGGQFPVGPIYITGFAWRAAPGHGALSVSTSGSVYASTGLTYPNTINGHPLLSTTFANNLGPDNTLVASGNFTMNGPGCAGPAPCPFANNIVFTTPFFYDPASGPLLLDVKATSLSGTGQFDVVDCNAPGCGLANIFGLLGSPTAASFNYGGNVTQITYTTVAPVTPGATTNFTYTANVSESNTRAGNLVGAAPVTGTPYGNGTGQLMITVPVDQNNSRTGDPYNATVDIFMNAADSFSANGSLPSIKNGVAETFTANLTGGTGAFNGASGSLNLTLTLGNPGSLTGGGNLIVNGKTTAVSLQSTFPNEGGEYFTSLISGIGTGTAGSLGTAAFQYRINDSVLGDPTSLTEGFVNFNFNANDGFRAAFKFPASPSGPPANTQGTIVGGTGAFSGATGTATLTLTSTNFGATLSGSGTVNVPAPGGPVITSVTTAFGPGLTAQNTWLAIKGNNLVPATTPAGGVDWSKATEFASGRMPIVLNGVGVKINNKPAYMYFFCSAVTSPTLCPVDQINVLAPLDTTLGGVPVVVTSPTGTSAPFQLRMETNSPAFLLFDTHGDIIARHLDAPNYSLLGPTSLYPGLTTPAKGGEAIWLAGIGFGLPTTTLADGSSSQSGPLATKPICFIGPNQATVLDASVVTPGLYILTVTVPTGTPSGDNLVTCTYQGNALFPSITPLGNVINVQ
jgi:uncharacterized protein (TIGR03437 family)